MHNFTREESCTQTKSVMSSPSEKGTEFVSFNNKDSKMSSRPRFDKIIDQANSKDINMNEE